MKVIAIYDLEDNLITILDGYKEVAKYFNTSVGVIKTHMCLKRQDKHRRKRFKGNWYKLEEIDMDFWSDEVQEANARINKAIRTLETLRHSARWERHLYEVDNLLSILKGDSDDK